MSFDVFESLFLMNEALHKATLYLDALATHERFDRDRISRYLERMKQVRAATNCYLVGVIQKAEAEVGMSA